MEYVIDIRLIVMPPTSQQNTVYKRSKKVHLLRQCGSVKESKIDETFTHVL